MVTFPVARIHIPVGGSVARLKGAFPQQPLGRHKLGGEVYVKPDQNHGGKNEKMESIGRRF